MIPSMLDDMRVLEVGGDLSGQYTGKLLAQMGADVLKLEPPTGDPSRRRGPYVRNEPHLEGSTLFLYLNAQKRGITLDISKATGAEILGRLAASMDVVIWGGNPAEAGAAFAQLPPDRPAVFLAVSAFGASGPHASWLAHGVNLYHVGGEGYVLPGGLTYLAYPDREPIKGPRYLGEFSAAVVSVDGILVARRIAEQQGGPLFVDVSNQEALLQFVRGEISQWADEGLMASRAMRSLGAGGLVPAKDGWVELMPLEQRMWVALMELMGNPDWSRDPAYATANARRTAGNAIVERVADWTATKEKAWLYEEGQRLGIAVGDVLTVSDVLASQQLAGRGFFVEIDHPYAGRLTYPGLPFHLHDGGPDGSPRLFGAPLLGQHNVEVLEGELGFSRREVVALFEAGIL
jgi:crotonobetainyl-CoA:carnitine CoA-transferase CaiB-like acyl-CoA transferase